jgi:biopolymer transport protein ExbD
MSRNRRRKSKGKNIFVTIIVLGLIVFLGADNFGFDWFNFKINLNNSTNTTQSNTTSKEKDKGTKYVNVVIKDNNITMNDELINIDTFKEKLNKLDSNNNTINLMDNGAYNETFTEVENMLTEKGFKVIISTIIK